MHRQIWSRTMLAVRFLVLVSVGAGFVAVPPVSAGETGDDAPLDLAALMLHSDELIWLLEQQGFVDEGWPYGMALSSNLTSTEEAVANEDYAIGRGGLSLSRMGEDAAAGFLEETGWIRAQNQLLALPNPRVDDERSYSMAVAVTIEEFATADGAEAGLRALDSEDIMAESGLATEVIRLDLPPAFEGMPAAMWEMDSTWYAIDGLTEIVTMWVQVDTLVVSVALIHGPGYVAPDPELLVPLVELQLKRIEHAEHLYQPGLSACAPELGGDEVTDSRFDYQVLNGQAFPWMHDTFDELAETQAEFDETGIVDMVHVSQSISESPVGASDGTVWFRGRTQTYVDEDHAVAFMAGHETALGEMYADVQALDDVPDLGDATEAYTYTGSDGNIATIVYVQVGLEVFSVRLGSTTEPVPEAAFELAELQLGRLESGDCADPLPVPRGL